MSARRPFRPHLRALTLSQSARVRSSVRASATLRTSRPRLQGSKGEKEGRNAEAEAAGGGRGDEAAAVSAHCTVQCACIHGWQTRTPPCMHAPHARVTPMHARIPLRKRQPMPACLPALTT